MTPFGSPVTASALPENESTKKPMCEADIGQAMMLLANKEGQRSRKHMGDARTRRPSPRELEALRALKGSMTSIQVAAAMGQPNTKSSAGFLSGLCTKGFVKRVGYEGKFVLWRKTRKGRKWTA